MLEAGMQVAGAQVAGVRVDMVDGIAGVPQVLGMQVAVDTAVAGMQVVGIGTRPQMSLILNQQSRRTQSRE